MFFFVISTKRIFIVKNINKYLDILMLFTVGITVTLLPVLMRLWHFKFFNNDVWWWSMDYLTR